MSISAISSTSLSGITANMMNRMQRPQGKSMDPAEMISQIIEQEDADKDGMISASESRLDSERFGQIDTDGDGLLTTEELEASFQTREADRAQRMVGMQPPPPPPDPAEMVAQIMQRDDQNGDGVIGVDEAPIDAEMFGQIDTDSDGVLTSEELTAHFEAGRPEAPTEAAEESSEQTMFKSLIEALSRSEANTAYADQNWLYTLLQSQSNTLAESA